MSQYTRKKVRAHRTVTISSSCTSSVVSVKETFKVSIHASEKHAAEGKDELALTGGALLEGATTRQNYDNDTWPESGRHAPIC